MFCGYLSAGQQFIVELPKHSPIIIQNSSNTSSQKKFGCMTVWPYDCTTVRPYKVLLLTCVVNCTAGTPTPRLCSVVQLSVHWAPSWTTWVLVLAGARHCALEMCGKKKNASSAFRLGYIYILCWVELSTLWTTGPWFIIRTGSCSIQV